MRDVEPRAVRRGGGVGVDDVTEDVEEGCVRDFPGKKFPTENQRFDFKVGEATYRRGYSGPTSSGTFFASHDQPT